MHLRVIVGEISIQSVVVGTKCHHRTEGTRPVDHPGKCLHRGPNWNAASSPTQFHRCPGDTLLTNNISLARSCVHPCVSADFLFPFHKKIFSPNDVVMVTRKQPPLKRPQTTQAATTTSPCVGVCVCSAGFQYVTFPLSSSSSSSLVPFNILLTLQQFGFFFSFYELISLFTARKLILCFPLFFFFIPTEKIDPIRASFALSLATHTALHKRPNHS